MKKKSLLLAIAAMSMAAVGVGTVGTFAWYQAGVAAKAGSTSITDTITTAVSTPTEKSVNVAFTIGTVTSPELSDSSGKTYYYDNGHLYEKVDNGANQIGQYAIKAALNAADQQIWTDAGVEKSYTVNLSAKTLENSVNVVLLADNADDGGDADADGKHLIKFTISTTGVVTINQIVETNATATTSVNGSADTSYKTNAKALFAVRPQYTDTSAYDAAGPYTAIFFEMDTPIAA